MAELVESLQKSEESDDDNQEMVVYGANHLDRMDSLDLRYTAADSRDRSLISRYGRSMRQLSPIRPFANIKWRKEFDKTNVFRIMTQGDQPSKIDQAGLLSFVTYSWVFSYLWTAFRGSVSRDHKWSCSMYDSASVNMARLEYLWNEELKRSPQRPSLIKVVCLFIRTRLIVSCLVFLFCLLFGFIGPTCLVRGLIAYAENPYKEDRFFGYILVFSILTIEILRVLSYGATWAVSYRTGIRVRGAVLGFLFKRLINVRSLKNKTSAEVVNIYANDGQRLFDAVTFAPLVMMGPLVLVGGIVYLLIVIGPWSLLGILIFVVFDAFQVVLGKTMVRCRNEAIEKTEKRISLMGEILRCIRVIKMNGWEAAFVNKVQELRQGEKRNLRTAGYAQSLAIASGPVVPVVATFVTFMAVVLSGHDLLASDAFSAITVFFVMLFGIRMIPYGSRYLAEAVVALRRVQEFLLFTEVDKHIPRPTNSSIAILLKSATFSWDEDAVQDHSESEPLSNNHQPTATLQNLNLIVEKKRLLGICGPVGSGKSALLHALIGHMVHKDGDMAVGGSVAFVGQSPWIQNLTLRENVLFGESLDKHRYYHVLAACGLTQDVNGMAANDQTEIGERGVTLSGGQKARLSLARALYSNREIYLIDDVFSSIDRSVADHIFADAIKGLLFGKTILMVTSDPQRLSYCDEVLYMEAGRIVDRASHKSLLSRCTEYKRFCEAATMHNVNDQRLDKLFEDDEAVSSPLETPKTPKSPETESDMITQQNSQRDRAQSTLTAADSLFDIPTATDGQITDVEEDLGLAAMSWSVYKRYILAAGGYGIWIVLMAAFVANVSASIFSTVWLSYWIKSGHQMVVNDSTNVTTMITPSLADNPRTGFFASIYALSLVFLFISGLFKAMIFVKVSLNAASRLHNKMFDRVIRGAMSFFDSTPSGRILNRFSKDIDEIDVKLPFTAEVFLQNMLTCIAYIIVIIWVFPFFLIASIPLICIFFVFVLCFRAGIRCLKRSENVSRSPLFDHISATLDGLSSIHAYNQTDRFLDTLKTYLDANSGAIFMFQSAMRWLAVWLDLLVVAITFITAFFIVILAGQVEPAYAGMALAFAIQMSGIFQFAVRTQTELEAKMTSVERIGYYIEHIEPEGEWINTDFTPPMEWPARGRVSFRDVKLKYRPNLPLALNGVCFDVKPKEKVGIVGRTGSGKSSLGNALFRLYPLTWGTVAIDEVDITLVGLHELRRSMAAIPQDPSLFAGTVRFNLDPEQFYSDAQLWSALEKTYIKDLVASMDGQLGAQINEGGRNLSVGQRQLLCMARALLRNVRILLLDEATASLDSGTDQLIQLCLKEAFKDCTLLVIAHRLDSVVNSDKIMIMDQGKMIEFDSPTTLLQNSKSRYAQILNYEQQQQLQRPNNSNEVAQFVQQTSS